MRFIEKYLKQLEEYFNGDLDPAQKLAFEKLIEGNVEAHQAWDEYCSLMEACSDYEAVSFRLMLEEAFANRNERQPRIVNNLWLRVSAAAIFIILIGSLTYLYNVSGEKWGSQNVMTLIDEDENRQGMVDTTSKSVQSMNDSLTLPNPQKPMKAREIASIYDREEYQISPVFAELLHNVYRSNWFRILLPEDSVMVLPGETINFSWETNIKEPLFFDILDRNGQVVYKEANPISSPWAFISNLPPAIYMYRFATEDQPVWMGVMVTVEG